VLTATPILPGIESQQAWEEHRDGSLQSIAPVGYLEKLLAVQLASISWRLDRVVRYEAEVAAAAVATAEPDLEERAEIGSGKPADPAEASTKAKSTYLIGHQLDKLQLGLHTVFIPVISPPTYSKRCSAGKSRL